jgi:hypothetical protein
MKICEIALQHLYRGVATEKERIGRAESANDGDVSSKSIETKVCLGANFLKEPKELL